jgi:phosphoglycerate kinase
VAILGGAKVSDKVNVITNLLGKVNSLLIGGAMAYTFYRAKGCRPASRWWKRTRPSWPARLSQGQGGQGVNLLLPVDHVIADKFDAAAATKVVGEGGHRGGLDGPGYRPQAPSCLRQGGGQGQDGGLERARWAASRWNPLRPARMAVAKAVAGTKCVSIIGGGDSVSAINKSGLADKITHISTGGGASLEFLEGKVLPGIAASPTRREDGCTRAGVMGCLSRLSCV